MRRGIQGCFVIVLGLALGLVAATLFQTVFVQRVQQPLCLSYAADHQFLDLTNLAFEDVVIATGRSRDHTCRFRNLRTGAPVELTFAPADTPTMIDTTQVLGMVLVFIVPALLVLRWHPRWSAP